MAFHPSGKEIGTAGIDGYVRVWDVDKGTSVVRTYHKADVKGDVGRMAGGADNLKRAETVVAMTRQAEELAGNALGMLTGGHAPPSKLLPKIPAIPDTAAISKHLSPVLRVAYSPDGRYLVSGALDPNITADSLVQQRVDPRGTVVVWDRTENKTTLVVKPTRCW